MDWMQAILRNSRVPGFVWGLLVLLALAGPDLSLAGNRQDPSVYEYKATRDLVAMVNDAADLFAVKGKAAFADFARPGSQWLRGNRYIFVYDLNGVCVFHPIDPQLVGKNLMGLKDDLGKPLIRWMVEIAKNPIKPYGWIHYLWPPPQTLFPLWKSSYVVGVRSPDGKRYFLGSGLYNMPMEKRFLVNLVDRAADLIAQNGVMAFPTLRDKASPYNLLGNYVYVFSPQGDLMVDPAFPPEGRRNALDYQDAVGHFFIRDLIDRLAHSDSAWVTYMWPKPGEANPSKKLMYARRLKMDGKTYLVGSDMYLSHPIWLHF
jgi:Cache domain